MKAPLQLIVVNVATQADIGRVCEQINLALRNAENGHDVKVVVVDKAFEVDELGRINHTESEPEPLAESQPDESGAVQDDPGSENAASGEDPNTETDDLPVVDAKPLTKAQLKAAAKAAK